jgi:hypothetical protein
MTVAAALQEERNKKGSPDSELPFGSEAAPGRVSAVYGK